LLRACRGDVCLLETSRSSNTKGSKMPKMKTKSGAKKRFKVTGTGKVVYQQKG
jgi:hypothetical protein